MAQYIGAATPARALATQEDLERLAHCFACGPDNPIGLHLDFRLEPDGRVWALFQPSRDHQGWPQVLHGGIVASMLDEAAAYVAYCRGDRTATARLNIRFHRPAPLGGPLRVEARLAKATRRLLEVEGVVATLSGEPIAEAQASLLVMTDAQKQTFGLAKTSRI